MAKKVQFMKAIAEDITAGKTYQVEVPDENVADLQSLARDRITDSQLQAFIDNLDLSADAKALIASIQEATVRVGEMVIRVGKKIVEIVVLIASKFPNTAFGLALGLIVGALVSAIPIIGGLLGAIVTPIATAFGLTAGFLDDIKDKRLADKVSEAIDMFRPLQGEMNVTSR